MFVADGARARLRDRRIALWLSAGLLALYVALGRGHFLGTDEIGVYQQARSLWERGDLAVGGINNTFPGRDGRWYSQYGVGQSVLALPLYALGKLCDRALPARWHAALAGPSIGTEPSRWGGDVPIFFGSLFGALVTAALGAVYYAASRRLGATPRGAVVAALLVGTTTHVLAQATTFLQHPLEALLLLSVFALLAEDARRPSVRMRAAAGALLGVALNVRVASLVALPALLAYAGAGWYARSRRDPVRTAREAAPLLLAMLPLAGVWAWVGWVKFGAVPPRFNNEGFATPLWVGLTGYLLSPGMAVWVFSPLLLISPWLLAWLWRRERRQAIAVLAIAASYLLCFAKYTAWHGLWSAFGPRYLVAVVPLLLLPLGAWLGERSWRVWLVVGPLAAWGALMQAMGAAVNFAYVYHAWRWPEFVPEYGFLFVPQVSPPAAFWDSLVHGRYVDLWLLNVWNDVGPGVAAALGAPLLALCAVAAVRVRRLVA
jgi:hypothetical protein